MNFIYETPWWLPTGLILCGVVLVISGNQRLNPRLLRGGLALLLLGITVALVSYLLESPREIVIRQTRMLAAAVEKGDWRTMEGLMQPNVTLAGYKGRQAVIEATQFYKERYRIKRVRISSLEAAHADPDITVTLQISALLMEGWTPETNWRLEWEEAPGGWRLGSIEFQGGPTIDIQSIERFLRK